MTDPERIVVTTTEESCWKCGRSLYALTPPLRGRWAFYCPRCEMLTTPEGELVRALESRPAGSVGIVAGIPQKLHITRPRGNGDA